MFHFSFTLYSLRYLSFLYFVHPEVDTRTDTVNGAIALARRNHGLPGLSENIESEILREKCVGNSPRRASFEPPQPRRRRSQ